MSLQYPQGGFNGAPVPDGARRAAPGLARARGVVVQPKRAMLGGVDADQGGEFTPAEPREVKGRASTKSGRSILVMFLAGALLVASILKFVMQPYIDRANDKRAATKIAISVAIYMRGSNSLPDFSGPLYNVLIGQNENHVNVVPNDSLRHDPMGYLIDSRGKRFNVGIESGNVVVRDSRGESESRFKLSNH